MELAERYGVDLRWRLFSADLFKEAAIARGLRSLKTESSSVSASLVSVTCCDHFLIGLELRAGALRVLALRALALRALAVREVVLRNAAFLPVAFFRCDRLVSV